MAGVTYKQRQAAMPSAALVGPATLDPTGRSGWPIATLEACGSNANHGFATNRSTRHLGRLST